MSVDVRQMEHARPPHTFIVAPSHRHAEYVQAVNLKISHRSRNVTHLTTGITARLKLADYRPDIDTVHHSGYPDHILDRTEIRAALTRVGAPTERKMTAP